MTDSRWSDETQRNVESHLTGDLLQSSDLMAENILDDLATQGLLLTPQIREVLEAARQLSTDSLLSLAVAATEDAPKGSRRETFYQGLVDELHAFDAAVDTYEAGQRPTEETA